MERSSMEKQQIGLLTFYHVLNYGALLQCFALQETIKELAGNCTIIPYKCPRLTENDRLISFQKLNPKTIAKWISQGYGTYKKKQAFLNFSRKYLNLPKQMLWDNYETIIVGSDQVWNLTLTGNDYTYFLENMKCRKIAYAASFGEDHIPSYMEKRLINGIKGFSKISFREKITCQYLDSFGIVSSAVADPVFLPDIKIWHHLADQASTSRPEHYILVYCVEKSEEVFSYAYKLSRKYQYPVIYLNQNFFFKKKGFIYKRGASPIDFLSYIREADFIVTNSFHGTAFSILFEKQFASDALWHGSVNKRLNQLLSTAGLENRTIQILTKSSQIEGDSICYEAPQKALARQRAYSIEYLKNALGDSI